MIVDYDGKGVKFYNGYILSNVFGINGLSNASIGAGEVYAGRPDFRYIVRQPLDKPE